MTRLGRQLAAVVLTLGTVASWLILAPASQGANATASGWWSTGGKPPVDLSPTGATPGPGELGVSATPTGAVSVAAVRYSLDPGEEPSALTLRIVSGAGQESGIVVVCPAASAWTAAEGGPADQAPNAACDVRLAAAKAAADGSLRFGLDPAFVTREGTLDLVIAPGTTDVGGAPITPPFDFVLAAPTSADLDTLQTGDPFADTFDSSDFTPAADAFDPAPTAGDTRGFEAAPSSDVTFSPDAGAATEPAPDGAAAFEEAVPVVVPAPGVPLGRARRAVSGDDPARAQRFGMLLFPVAVLGAIWALNTSTPALRGIGRLGHPTAPGAGGGETGPVEAGLSRFRRSRAEPPVPLR